MSYWVSICTKGGKEIEECGNFTSNCSGMFFKASGGMNFRELDGVTVSKAYKIIAKVLIEMTATPDTYRGMEPDNGWGSYECYMSHLALIAKACEENQGRYVCIN